MTATSPLDCYRGGQLDDAVGAAIAAVKQHPADVNARFQLSELSCIAGDLDRADRQLDVLSNQDPQAGVMVALWRQLIRAELARRECFRDGRVPEFLGPPPKTLTEHLRAIACYREGDHDAAVEAIADTDPTLSRAVDVNGTSVNELRDLDDLLAPVLEVHTSTGKYFWVDWNQILHLQAVPPKRPLDLLWRRASLSIEEGPDGEVFLPAIYPVVDDSGDQAEFRLGRRTDWLEIRPDLIRGVGQKMLMAGDSELAIMELDSIERTSSAS